MKRVLLFAIFTAFTALLGTHTSSALSSDPNHFISGDNTFYAYVKAGEKISAEFLREPYLDAHALHAREGKLTITVDGPDMKQQKCIIDIDVQVGEGCIFKARTAKTSGVWRIEVKAPDDAVTFKQGSPDIRWVRKFFNWKIVVSGSEGEESGRIWTDRYAFRQPNDRPDRSFTGDFVTHYISEDGYIYKASNIGYNGQVSILSADSIGIRKNEECISAYQSASVDDDELAPALGTCGNRYKLFFEEPAGNLPAEAIRWDGEKEWILPTIKRPEISELLFTPEETSDQLSGTISFFMRNFIGQYQIKIDVDNDGSFDGQHDVVLYEQLKSLSSSLQQVRFQGVDKNGQIIFPSQKIGIKVEITKVAEIHFVAVDVEGRQGIEVTRINGANAPTTRLCWNDTDLTPITNLSLMTEEVDGRSCPDSTGGVHGWSYGGNSWGDKRYIDDWAYASVKIDGKNTITYPEDESEEESSANSNGLLMLIGGLLGVIVLVAIIVTVFMTRKGKNNPPPPLSGPTSMPQSNPPAGPPADGNPPSRSN